MKFLEPSFTKAKVFLLRGADVTSFISIFRFLKSKNELGHNVLVFANKTKADIILEKAFCDLLGNHFIKVLSDESGEGCAHGPVTPDLLRENISGNGNKIYLCGPEPMVEATEAHLKELGIGSNAIVKERF